MFHFYRSFSVCREPHSSFTRFRKPCCGLDLRSGETPLGAGAGLQTRRCLPKPSRAHAPRTFLLGEASPDTRRGWSRGANSSPSANRSEGPSPGRGPVSGEPASQEVESVGPSLEGSSLHPTAARCRGKAPGCPLPCSGQTVSGRTTPCSMNRPQGAGQELAGGGYILEPGSWGPSRTWGL